MIKHGSLATSRFYFIGHFNDPDSLNHHYVHMNRTNYIGNYTSCTFIVQVTLSVGQSQSLNLGELRLPNHKSVGSYQFFSFQPNNV